MPTHFVVDAEIRRIKTKQFETNAEPKDGTKKEKKNAKKSPLARVLAHVYIISYAICNHHQ